MIYKIVFQLVPPPQKKINLVLNGAQSYIMLATPVFSMTTVNKFLKLVNYKQRLPSNQIYTKINQSTPTHYSPTPNHLHLIIMAHLGLFRKK